MRRYSIILLIASMGWLTADILTDGGYIQMHGDSWQLVLFVWGIYGAGVMTGKLYKTKENCELDDSGLENSGTEIN